MPPNRKLLLRVLPPPPLPSTEKAAAVEFQLVWLYPCSPSLLPLSPWCRFCSKGREPLAYLFPRTLSAQRAAYRPKPHSMRSAHLYTSISLRS